jgi:hypothetical protein
LSPVLVYDISSVTCRQSDSPSNDNDTDEGITIVDNLEHPWNILSILVTLLGITTDDNDVHPLKIPQPILVTLSGITTEDSDVHPLNAPSPILLTLLGIITDVNDVHPLNAKSSILVTILAITIILALVLVQHSRAS